MKQSTSRKPLRFLLPALLLIAAITIAGCEFSCSTGGGVSASELETQIKEAYKGETGVAFQSISCEDADSDVGSPINCTGKVNGIDLKITGEVTSYNAKSDKVNFSWSTEPVK